MISINPCSGFWRLRILGALSVPAAVAAFPGWARKTTAARIADPMQIVRIGFMTVSS
jgi:hypothetical protein